MSPEVVHTITGEDFQMEEAKIVGWSRHALRNRAYPGIVRKAGSVVVGKILYDISCRAMCLLCMFEGDEYSLTQTTATNKNGKRLCVNTYAWAGKISDVLSEPWDPIAFQRDHLSRFIARLRRKSLRNESVTCSTCVKRVVNRWRPLPESERINFTPEDYEEIGRSIRNKK